MIIFDEKLSNMQKDFRRKVPPYPQCALHDVKSEIINHIGIR